MPTASRRAIWTLYFIVFIDIFQITFIFPLIPKIVEVLSPALQPIWQGGPAWTPAEKIGLVAGLGAGAEGIAAPYLGRLADRIGRRPVFVIAQCGSIASSVLIGISGSYGMLVGARILEGACGGTAGIAAAYIADVTSPEERPGYMTYYMAAIFLGLSVGPGVGGALSLLGGWRAACLAAAGVCGLNLLCTLLFLPDAQGQLVAPSEEDVPRGGSCPGRLWRRVCGKSLPVAAWLICCSNFLASVGWTAFEALGVIYVKDSYFSSHEKQDAETMATTFYSELLSGAGVVGLVVNLFLYAPVERRTGLKGSIALGGVLKAVGYMGVALPRLGGKWAMFTAVQVLVLGDQLQSTSIQTLITCVVPPTRFGEAMGQMTLFGNIARTIGPFAFGPIYEKGGKTVPWTANIFASLLAAVFCSLARPRSIEQEAGDPEEPAVSPDSRATLVRHLSQQTSRSMLLGQAAFAKRSRGDMLLRRTWSAPASRADTSSIAPELPTRSQTGV